MPPWQAVYMLNMLAITFVHVLLLYELTFCYPWYAKWAVNWLLINVLFSFLLSFCGEGDQLVTLIKKKMLVFLKKTSL